MPSWQRQPASRSGKTRSPKCLLCCPRHRASGAFRGSLALRRVFNSELARVHCAPVAGPRARERARWQPFSRTRRPSICSCSSLFPSRGGWPCPPPPPPRGAARRGSDRGSERRRGVLAARGRCGRRPPRRAEALPASRDKQLRCVRVCARPRGSEGSFVGVTRAACGVARVGHLIGACVVREARHADALRAASASPSPSPSAARCCCSAAQQPRASPLVAWWAPARPQACSCCSCAASFPACPRQAGCRPRRPKSCPKWPSKCASRPSCSRAWRAPWPRRCALKRLEGWSPKP